MHRIRSIGTEEKEKEKEKEKLIQHSNYKFDPHSFQKKKKFDPYSQEKTN